jgi:uncharacterized protein (TIGR00255 family)
MQYLHSMTGYARLQLKAVQCNYTIELRALNSQFLDINVRLPLRLKSKEIEIRKQLSEQLLRGKIDVFINIESNGVETIQNINEKAFEAYYNTIMSLSNKLNIAIQDPFSYILRIPEVFNQNNDLLNNEEWNAFKAGLQQSIIELLNYRKNEGESIYNDINIALLKMSNLKDEIITLDSNRIESVKNRLRKNLQQWMEEKYDENRFHQELIYYTEKLDINEEIIRLTQHLAYAQSVLKNDNIQKGKSLGFVIQEIGREINTIGSKANDAAIQMLVVQMKNEQDKIKEQIQNVL